MKRIVLLLSLTLSAAAHADQAPAWQQKLEAYKVSLDQSTNAGLQVRQGYYIGAAVTTCALSTVVTGATFVADTVPLTSILGEGLANVANPDYMTYKQIMEWETLAGMGRGTVGGAGVAVIESLEFVVLWLAGNETQAFEGLKKNYASSFATMESLFAQQGQCMMNISKVLITRAEIARRGQLPSPMRVPVEVNRP